MIIESQVRCKLASKLSGLYTDTTRNGVGMADLCSVRDSQLEGKRPHRRRQSQAPQTRPLCSPLADPTTWLVQCMRKTNSVMSETDPWVSLQEECRNMHVVFER